MPIQVTLFCCQLCLVLYAATVVLNSSLGMRQACPGEMVTYNCTVNQGFRLEWAVGSFISFNTGIQFTSTNTIGTSFDCSGVTAVRCEDLNFLATLTDTSNSTVVMRTTLADMTSTLALTATARLNGTVVQCRGSTADATPINSSILNVAGVSILFDIV